jgi:hypothetical protein
LVGAIVVAVVSATLVWATVYAPLVLAAAIEPTAILSARISTAGVPSQIEGVPTGATLGVLNAHNGDATVSRIANQLLLSPAIDPAKSEVRRIRR